MGQNGLCYKVGSRELTSSVSVAPPGAEETAGGGVPGPVVLHLQTGAEVVGFVVLRSEVEVDEFVLLRCVIEVDEFVLLLLWAGGVASTGDVALDV